MSNSTPAKPESCWTCQNHHCALHVASKPVVRHRQAFLVDEYWPEFNHYIAAQLSEDDVFLSPLDGKRWNKPAYGWDQHGTHAYTAPWVALKRGLSARFTASEGAALRVLQEKMSAELYERYRRKIPYTCRDFVIDQSLLPYAFRSGDLGGREYDVLMTRYPIRILQQRLDEASRLHPQSRTLADYRADQKLADDEWAALQGARRVLTPHVGVGALFPGRATVLPWELPRDLPQSKGPRVAFLGPTIGRKGCYEVRELAWELKLELVVFGRSFEGQDFWDGLKVEMRWFDSNAWTDIGMVLQPSYAESRPRKLLEAYARGIQVFATAECGLPAGLYTEFRRLREQVMAQSR